MSGSNADNTAHFDTGPHSSRVFYGAMGTSYITGAFRLQKKYEDYNADKYSLTDELDFMTREDIIFFISFFGGCVMVPLQGFCLSFQHGFHYIFQIRY